MARKASAVLLAILVVVSGVAPMFATGTVTAEDREPNDDFDTAVPVSEGSFTGEISNGESDFFQLDANTTDALRAEITSADALDDLELRVYTADRSELISDTSGFEGLDTIIKLPETGTYYIEVAGQSPDTNSSYTLNLDVITPAENDQFAPNDDFGSAAPLTEGFSDARIVGGESDFYRFEANTTDAISAAITSADTLGDLSLTLYGPDRGELITDGNEFEGVDFNLKAPENGTYYLEVAGQSQQTTSNYTLNLDVITPAENDQFAPNDDFASAAPITEGLSDARIVGGESDFYRLEANTTDALSAAITSADDIGDLSLTLYDANQQQLVSDANDFDGINFNLKAPETGTYYIEVAGQSQQTTSDYTLDTDIITPAENDEFAPNDDFASAAPIPEGISEARLVGGESDFYRLEANSTDAISMEITQADSLDDLAIRLYSEEQTQLLADGNDFDGIGYTLKAPGTGTYYVEIAGQSQQTTSAYTVNTDIITPAENDQFAPNSDIESAVQLRNEFTDAQIVGGEADYYKLTLNESERVESELTSADTLDDLALRLYAPNGTQVAGDGSDFEGVTVSHQASTSGTYYIEVAGQSQETTSAYRLRSNQTFTGASPVQVENVTLTPNSVETNTTNDHTLSVTVDNVSADDTQDTLTVTLPETVSLERLNAGRLVDQRANVLADVSAGPSNESELTLTVNPQSDTGPATRTVRGEFNLTVAAPTSSDEIAADITVDVTDSRNGQDSVSESLTVTPPAPTNPVVEYTNDNGVVTNTGLRTAVDDWRAGDVDNGLLRDVVDAWRTQEPVV